MTETRRCANCFKTKPVTEFHRRSRTDPSKGYQWWCRDCSNEVHREYCRRKREKEMRARWDRVYGRKTS